ncbi:hypothetical protein DPMN_084880 [Dreissena polymorpha]|uniref:Uncharacterized protein n=1 Tax=Dreissena polymorpha TaxID=45954 RepID=A0A9D3YDZ3_DREPO|nr:hypothetical protein DPMN_084880 [Dreissena polymorpha]
MEANVPSSGDNPPISPKLVIAVIVISVIAVLLIIGTIVLCFCCKKRIHDSWCYPRAPDRRSSFSELPQHESDKPHSAEDSSSTSNVSNSSACFIAESDTENCSERYQTSKARKQTIRNKTINNVTINVGQDYVVIKNNSNSK